MNIRHSKTFCILPWIHLHVMPNGSVLPCCVSPYDDIYGDGQTQSFKEIFNSEKFKQLRKNMLSNTASDGCKRCYQVEKAGFKSFRSEMNESFKDYFPKIGDTQDDGSIDKMRLRYIDIRFSNLCNFKCRGCGPILSSSWHEDHQALYNLQSSEKKIKSISQNSPNFWNELKEIIPNTDIIYFGGGEPLLNQEHFELLRLLIGLNKFKVKLRYSTNLSQLNYGVHDITKLWNQFESVSLSISIDDIGSRAEYFRHGTKWEVIEKNLKTLFDFHPHIERTINCTINIMNVFYLPEIIKYFFDLELIAPHDFNFNLLLDPIEYRIDGLPKKMKQKTRNKLTKFKFYLQGQNEKYHHTINDLGNILNFMDAQDLSENLPLFKQTTLKLDTLRNENFTETFSEISELLTMEYNESATIKQSY